MHALHRFRWRKRVVLPFRGAFEFLAEAPSVEDVVAQHQAGWRVANEVGTEDERLGETVRAGIFRPFITTYIAVSARDVGGLWNNNQAP